MLIKLFGTGLKTSLKLMAQITLPFLLLASCSNLSVKGIRDQNQPFFRVAWSKNLDIPYHKLESGAWPIVFHSPLIHQGILYVGDLQGQMFAYDAENGRELWRVKEKHAIVNTPTIFQKMVIFGTADGRLHARNYQNGDLKYAVDLGDAVESPAIADEGGRLFVHLRNHKIIALDGVSGKILWSYTRTVSLKTTIQQVSTPVVQQNRVYVGFADGYVVALSADEGQLLWERNIESGNKFVDVDMQITFSENLLYIASSGGPLTVIKPDSGVVLRRFEHRVFRPPHFLEKEKNNEKNEKNENAILGLGQGMLIGTDKGEIIHLDKQGNVFNRKQVSSAALLGITFIKDHLLVFSLKDEILLLKWPSLEKQEVFSLGSKNSLVFGAAASSEDRVGILSSRNRLYVFSYKSH